MLNLKSMIAAEIEKGYNEITAPAKVCQDIVLKAISVGPLQRKITVKGGVVMRSKTGNIRRATQDSQRVLKLFWNRCNFYLYMANHRRKTSEGCIFE